MKRLIEVSISAQSHHLIWENNDQHNLNQINHHTLHDLSETAEDQCVQYDHFHCFMIKICHVIIASVRLHCIFFELSFLRFCWSFNNLMLNMLESILNSDSVSEASSVFFRYAFWILMRFMMCCNSTLQSVQSWLSRVNSMNSEWYDDRWRTKSQRRVKKELKWERWCRTEIYERMRMRDGCRETDADFM